MRDYLDLKLFQTKFGHYLSGHKVLHDTTLDTIADNCALPGADKERARKQAHKLIKSRFKHRLPNNEGYRLSQ